MSFIQAKGYKLYLNNKEFRFIGCNMFELAYVEPQIAKLMLLDAKEEGFTVVRFWFFFPAEHSRLKLICREAEELGLFLIPVLADKWGYLQSYKIENGWYDFEYRKHYLPHIQSCSEEFNNEKSILLWELLNEPEADSFDSFYKFVSAAASEFKKLNTNHLLSLGTIGGIGDKVGGELSRFNVFKFYKLALIKDIDCLSIHDYSYDASLFERLDIYSRFKGNLKAASAYKNTDDIISPFFKFLDKLFLNKLNILISFPFTIRRLWRIFNNINIFISRFVKKPIYIGEIGYKKNISYHRGKILDIDSSQYFGKGISGLLLWSFEAQGWSNDGHDYGFKPQSSYADVVKKWNSKFAKVWHS